MRKRLLVLAMLGLVICALLAMTGGAAPRPNIRTHNLSFPPTPVASTSTLTTHVVNCSLVSVTIGNVGITPIAPSATNFFLNGTNCPSATLPPGARCFATITFAPAVAGPESADLFFDTTLNGITIHAILTGTGI